MKTTRHSLMAKGIMVLLSLLVLVFAFTLSWFRSNPEADASGASFSAKAEGDFEYAIGFYNNGTGGDYKVTPFTNSSTALNLENLLATDGETYNLLHDYMPIDVTGDGRTLIRPAMMYGNSSIDTTSLDYSIAEQNVQYISFDLYFRSKISNVPINLGYGSYSKGKCETEGVTNFTITDTSNTNKSTYGNFSKDAVVGAVRIAFVPYTKNLPSSFSLLSDYQDNTPQYLSDTASLLWLPRPELHLNATSNTTGWTLTTNSTSSADKTHTYYNIFECYPAKSDGPNTGESGYHTVVSYSNNITTADLDPSQGGSNRNFANINSAVHIGEYYYTKVSTRIWVEGTDAEARRAVSGGRFCVNFVFSTYN